MNDENFGLKKTLAIRIEELNPSFLNNDIMSVHGDHRRLTFRIKYKEECYFIECQIEPISDGHINCYIITKEYDTQYIINSFKFDGYSSEYVIRKICEFLDERFS